MANHNGPDKEKERRERERRARLRAAVFGQQPATPAVADVTAQVQDTARRIVAAEDEAPLTGEQRRGRQVVGEMIRNPQQVAAGLGQAGVAIARGAARDALTGPTGTITVGEREFEIGPTQRNVRALEGIEGELDETLEEIDAFYGEPETTGAVINRVIGRAGGEIGAILGLKRVTRLDRLGRAARRLPGATRFQRFRRGLNVAGAEIVEDAPIPILVSAVQEESVLGALAEVTDSEMLDDLAESRLARGAAEVLVDAGALGTLGLLRFGARAAAGVANKTTDFLGVASRTQPEVSARAPEPDVPRPREEVLPEATGEGPPAQVANPIEERRMARQARSEQEVARKNHATVEAVQQNARTRRPMTQEEFVGKPEISESTAEALPVEFDAARNARREVFLDKDGNALTVGRGINEVGEPQYNVWDGDRLVASMDARADGTGVLAVDPAYRDRGIGSRLVFDLRVRHPDLPPALLRTSGAQRAYERAWRMFQDGEALQPRISSSLKDQGGFSNSTVQRQLAAGMLGGYAGAMLDDENRIRGAAVGALALSAGPQALARGYRVLSPRNFSRFIAKHLTSPGALPRAVFNRFRLAGGKAKRTLSQLEFDVADLGMAVRRAGWGNMGSLSPERAKLIDQAIKTGDVSALPTEELQEVVRRATRNIDHLEQQLIDAGLTPGKLDVGFEVGAGLTMRRAYRTFFDPEFADNVALDVRNRAKAFVRDQVDEFYAARRGRAPSEEAIAQEVEDILTEIIYAGKGSRSPMDFLAKHPSIAKRIVPKAGDTLHPAIREVWGELNNPVNNYVTAVDRAMTRLVRHQALIDVNAAALKQGQWLHSEPKVIDGVNYTHRIDEPGLGALNGSYTSEEIAEALKNIWTEHSGFKGAWRVYMGVNGAAKFSKTVLSPQTHMRNLTGNLGFAIANGHFNINAVEKVWEAIGKRSAITQVFDPTARRAGIPQQTRDYIGRLTELGVIDEAVRAGELVDVLADTMAGGARAFEPNVLLRGGKKTTDFFARLYRAEDDVWKIFAFENELARYTAAMPELGSEALEEMAASIVRRTYPTYSLVPELVKKFRRAPAFGTFVSFSAEVLRVGYNTIELGLREVANPATRKIGYQRLAGLAAAGTIAGSLAASSRFFTGMSTQDDKDVRQFVPSWNRNSDLITVKKEDGRVLYIDISYTDPWSQYRKAATAALTGGEWEQRLLTSTAELLGPFLDEELLFASLVDVLRNRTGEGRRVYNPQAPGDDKAIDIAQRLLEPVTPGAFASFERLRSSLPGHAPAPGSRQYNLSAELAALTTGVRISEVDVPRSLSFRMRDFTEDRQDARRHLNQVAANPESSDKDILEAQRFANERERVLYEEAVGVAAAARRLGVPESEVLQILRESPLSRRDALRVTEGLPFIPRQIDKTFLRDLQERSGTTLERREELIRRRLLLIDAQAQPEEQ